jgi:hypothetical protein
MQNKIVSRIINYFSPTKFYRYVVTFRYKNEYDFSISNYFSSIKKTEIELDNFLTNIVLPNTWEIHKIEIETLDMEK